MKKQYFFLLALTQVFSHAVGQEDFIVTTKGDTLRGRVSFQQIGNIEQVLVKGDKRQTFSSMQIRIANVKGQAYKPIQFSGKVQMMQVVTNGYLSLLAFQPPGVMNYDGRLLALRDGRMLEVPTIGFKKHLSAFLSDDADLAQKIKEGELERKNLDAIIEAYNTFIEKNTEINDQKTKEEDKTKIKLEALEEIKEAITTSDMESKDETLEMLNEVKDKISTGKSVPQYLSNALLDKLQFDPELIKKLEGILHER